MGGLNRNELGRFIHFTTVHNHLCCHKCLLERAGDDKCRLCGGGREDAVKTVQCRLMADQNKLKPQRKAAAA